MVRRNVYYAIKPHIPARIRVFLRGWFARRKRARVSDIWPILPGSERSPLGWEGWPNGNEFALVLTHDVERPEGLARVRELAELEMSLGFRSVFNFVPSGSYAVPSELRAWLIENGFEVGVHDLRHDGKLFSSRRTFRKAAQSINQALRLWGARGFRAGFMLHELDWFHDLDIDYDCSSFDTDPFEPQPDGAGTIFPFFVPRDEERRGEIEDRRSTIGSEGPVPPLPSPSSDLPPDKPRRGYVELPYTLVQDSTLFLLLGESTIDIWVRKLEWIARHGGMAMLITHPDYMNFDSTRSPLAYPSTWYAQFLEHIKSQYLGRFWKALPCEVARHFHHRSSPQ